MAWDKSIPADDELLINFPGLCRANWAAIEELTTALLQITNAKVASSAAIADTKLAQITTAGKVSGAALTALSSIPSGAGAVPTANLTNAVTVINTLTEKETPHVDDLFIIEDSQAGNARRKLKYSSIGNIPDESVTTAKLKTTTGEVSRSGPEIDIVLPGGSYGFYPQIKAGDGGTEIVASISGIATSSSYITNIYLGRKSGSATVYAQQRYVTASGKDLWVFLLVDKSTGEIEAAYAASDHPAYGNGGDIDALPHPFIGNNFGDKEVVVLGEDEAEELKSSTIKKGSILTTLHKRFARVDLSREGKFSPLHTGLFSGKKPVMVEKLPAGIHIRALIDR